MDLIRLGHIETALECSGGRGTTVRQIVWHQASLRHVFDDDQQLLNAFYKAIYHQIVDGITLEQLLAADSSNIPALLLRHSFSNSQRGPAVYIVKLKPQKERSIQYEMIHCVQRIWKFAEIFSPGHESARLLRLNYMRLVASYYYYPSNLKQQFSLAETLSCADSFEEWFQIRSALNHRVMLHTLQEPLLESVLLKFVQFCRREPRQHSQTLPHDSQHVSAAVDLLIQNIKETRDKKAFWVLIKALAVLHKRELAHQGADSSSQPACAVICGAILSNIAPLLVSAEKMETLSYLSIAAFSKYAASQSRAQQEELLADCASRLPLELNERFFERFLFQTLVTKANALLETTRAQMPNLGILSS
jgi:hypothetical protein